MATLKGLTWNDIPGIHGILVFNESKAAHELDLGDLTSTMSGKMGLDICLRRCEDELAELSIDR